MVQQAMIVWVRYALQCLQLWHMVETLVSDSSKIQVERLLEHLHGIWVLTPLQTDTMMPATVTEPAYQLTLSTRLGGETLFV